MHVCEYLPYFKLQLCYMNLNHNHNQQEYVPLLFIALKELTCTSVVLNSP
jgi:hypothetical protein